MLIHTKTVKESEGYEYVVENDSAATIVGCSPSLAGRQTIPAELDGHPVKKVGKGAFSSAAFAGMEIPPSVEEICDGAFYWCAQLKEVSFSEGLRVIGDRAFAVCSELASISLPSTVAGLGEMAFHKCTRMSRVELNANLQSIGSFAFGGCSSLTHIAIPESVVEMGDSAFFSCTHLKHVELPGGLRVISDGLFYKCSSLQSVALPEKLETIGKWAFKSCSALASITIPDYVSEIGRQAFDGCSALPAIAVLPVNPWFDAWQGVIFTRDMKKLVRCPEGMKGGYVIPEGVEVFEDGAFDNCALLKEITIPSTMKEVSGSAFHCCRNLVKVTVKPENKSFRVSGDMLFTMDMKRLVCCLGDKHKTYEIPDGVVEIDEFAFANCTRMTSLLVPDSVSAIGQSAFAGCSGLARIDMPAQLDEITQRLFFGCKALVDVIVPPGVKKIGAHAFDGCMRLAHVAIPDSLEHIGHWAFYGCKWQPPEHFGKSESEGAAGSDTILF